MGSHESYEALLSFMDGPQSKCIRNVTWDLFSSNFDDYIQLYHRVIDLGLDERMLKNTLPTKTGEMTRLASEQTLLPFLYQSQYFEEWMFCSTIHTMKIDVNEVELLESRIID